MFFFLPFPLYDVVGGGGGGGWGIWGVLVMGGHSWFADDRYG